MTRSCPRRSAKWSRTRCVSSSPRTESGSSGHTCLILIGPTGVGKTAALREVAGSLTDIPFEIISADSRQVYRGLDIGTAKPSLEERAAIPHHLIDEIDPGEPWDVGRFVESTDRLIGEIRARGAVPVISGGTAFYVRGYLFGLPGTPKAAPALRRDLEQRLDEQGLDALREELRRVDPESDARIAPGDGYRVLRALEVYHTAGRPLSGFPVPSTLRPGVKPVTIGLTREREVLYQRINHRVAVMFAAGLPEEVAALYARGYRLKDPGMQSIGYREFLEAGDPPWEENALERIRELIARNTRRYAKRQETFFRRIPGVVWIDADDRSLTSRVHDGILRAHF